MKRIKDRFRGFLPIVVDVETAGFDPENNALLEVAVIFMDYQDGHLVVTDTLHEHIIPEPGLEMDQDALEFTQIIPDHPFRMAITEKEMLEKLQGMLLEACKKSGCSRAVLVGHNGQFDLSFLQAASNRQQVNLLLHRFLVFDTATLSAVLLGETVLARAVRRAKMPFDETQAHGALYDASITAKLFSKLVRRVDENHV